MKPAAGGISIKFYSMMVEMLPPAFSMMPPSAHLSALPSALILPCSPQHGHSPHTSDVETHTLPATTHARDLVEAILSRWKKSGLCDSSDVLIIHAQSDIAKSPLGDRRILAGRNLRECTEDEDSPGCIRHTSIHKAKGLDSKAVILIGLPPHKNLASDYDHYSWFMAVSRARQLLAIVESS